MKNPKKTITIKNNHFMKSIEFPEATNKIAENQEQFNTLISQWNPKEQSINVCFALSDEEVEEIVTTRKLWYKQVTGRNNMHPMRISPFKKEMIMEREKIMEMKDIDTTTPEGKGMLTAMTILAAELYPDHSPGEILHRILEFQNKMRFEK